jgi:peptidoglycan/LPS O-acetylase OafA/YrhL
MNRESALDGVRAVAIVAVLLYHMGVPSVSGGFVGVDVFFVLSGYLITRLLVTEQQRSGDINIAAFWERRLRRLAPAFFLVLLVSLLLGALMLTPVGGEQQAFSRSAIASATLWANHYFLHFTGGYFDGPAEQQPLLHLWSLAVEGQFYLLWPGLLALVLRKCAASATMRSAQVLVAAVGILSFALSLWLSYRQASVAFYLMPARAWEFALGGWIGLHVLQHGMRLSAVGAVLAGGLGLGGIVLAAVLFSPSMVFPGSLALLPVLCTGLLLYSASTANPISRLLGSGLMQWLGLRSYSWYLWHWPLLAFWRIQALGELTLPEAIVLVLLALFLADLTYRFVEVPARQGKWKWTATPARTRRSSLVVAALTVVFALYLGVYAKFVWPKLPGKASHAAALLGLQKVRVACISEAPYSGPLPQRQDCDLPAAGSGAAAANPAVVLWGDSHAAHLVPWLEDRLSPSGQTFRIRYMPECPPLLGFDPALIGLRRPVGCQRFNDDVAAEVSALQSSASPLTVVLNAHWMGYGSSAAGLQAVREGLERTVSYLKGRGVRVLLLAPAPDMPFDVPVCLLRRRASDCDLPRAEADAFRAPVFQAMLGLVPRFGAALIDPFASLCDAGTCPAQRGDMVLYSDSHHLTVAGSRALGPLP